MERAVMATYNIECKNCGAQNLCEEGKQVLACTHCESLLTVARAFDTRGSLFNRANYLRRNSEFDKALAAYEEILRQDNTEYEAHWGIVLCRYGIEYVEDPITCKRVPTCHRTQYDSILNDAEYMAAREYAPYDVRAVYEDEAAYIAKVQKGILALAQQQEQFDVFLCYKETDAEGNRSQDSVLAQELEFELGKRGYRVFFARKTLAGKLGTAYEPVIFSALHSAKVMVALGTKPEHFAAVWVKNEWSRYRELIKKGEEKTLIPAYRGMSPYDLPQEFAELQALDMGKLGFVQDLCDGIDRLAKTGKQPDPKPVPAAAAPGVESLLTRAQLFMEDGDWASANAYIEKVLDINPKYAPAYMARLMTELHLSDEKQLARHKEPLTGLANFQKALRFADAAQKKTYEGYDLAIQERLEAERKNTIYEAAAKAMREGRSTPSAYPRAAALFRSISGYKDANAQDIECNRLAEEARIAKDNAERRARAKEGQDRLAAEKAERQRIYKRNRSLAIGIPLCVVVILLIVLVTQVIIPSGHYRDGEALLAAGKYAEASEAFKQAGGYKDAAGRIYEPFYEKGETLLADKEYDKAIEAFTQAGSYSDAALKLQGAYYESGKELLTANNYREALAAFINAKSYQDSDALLKECNKQILLHPQAGDIVTFGNYEQDSITADGKEAITWRVLSVKDGKALLLSEKNLDCKPYNKEYTAVTWETCTLRAWLNNEFINDAFTQGEKDSIAQSAITNSKNLNYGTDGGNTTLDKVFLLSIEEAEQYLASVELQKAANTAYAVQNGAYDNNGYGWWWLRSPGFDTNHAAYVHSGGSLHSGGYDVSTVDGAVRPALYLNLGS
jgi:tetratricopeptide (TPR) repeat protein